MADTVLNRSDDDLADDLAEQVVLHYVNPDALDEDPSSELSEYLKSLELHPPFLSRKDYLNQKSLSRQLVGLPSFLRAVQNQREDVLGCLSMPEGDGKQARAVYLWGKEAIF